MKAIKAEEENSVSSLRGTVDNLRGEVRLTTAVDFVEFDWSNRIDGVSTYHPQAGTRTFVLNRNCEKRTLSAVVQVAADH